MYLRRSPGQWETVVVSLSWSSLERNRPEIPMSTLLSWCLFNLQQREVEPSQGFYAQLSLKMGWSLPLVWKRESED